MIGMSCTQFGVKDPEVIMDMVSQDFKLWEIFSEDKHNIIKFAPRFNEIKKSFGMKYSIHAPICDINIASLNDKMRKASVDEMIKTIECANKMDIKTVTIHPGIYSMVLYEVKGISEELARSSLKKIAKAADQYGVTAAIENMPSFAVMMGQTPEGLLDLIEDTELKVCFDIGHANTMGMINGFIDLFQDKQHRLANIHIHDNMGDKDAHMTIGDGNIDFYNVLSRLRKYRGNYIIESRDLDSAIESKKRLEKMLKRI